MVQKHSLEYFVSLSLSVKRIVSRACEDISTPRALSVSILMRYGEWDQLAALQVNPEHYTNAFDYWRDAQATAFLRKYEPLPTTVDRAKVALSTFYECERECYRSNERLSPYLEGGSHPSVSGGVLSILLKARKTVASILGPCPTLLEGRFGPGATFGDKGVSSTLPDKMSSSPTLTHAAWPFLFQWTGTLWAKALCDVGKAPKTVPGNRFTTVPKDCTKNRGIAVEPSINVFYQLAYGKVIRSRLSRWGINLNEGQDIHRNLAMASSLDGSLATLDLSNASDTICKNLVKFLLPPSWYEWLSAIRSPKTLVEGRWVLLEKFSSMGNGFTFELETLIFLSLVSSVCGEDQIGNKVFAYGDDLIFPSESFEDVCSVLRFCGFTPNKKKSFSSGYFRESCGGDFFGGVGVRPYFIKEDPDAPEKLFALANGLNRSISGHLGREIVLKRAWLDCLGEIPSPLRCLRGPSDLGDIVIHDSPSLWKTKCVHGIRYVKAYRPAKFRKVLMRGFADSVTLATSVYGQPVGLGYVIPRDGVTGYKIDWVPYS